MGVSDWPTQFNGSITKYNRPHTAANSSTHISRINKKMERAEKIHNCYIQQNKVLSNVLWTHFVRSSQSPHPLNTQHNYSHHPWSVMCTYSVTLTTSNNARTSKAHCACVCVWWALCPNSTDGSVKQKRSREFTSSEKQSSGVLLENAHTSPQRSSAWFVFD